MEKEKQLLLLCCRQIEQTLNWGDSDAWTNDDFEQLSEKIFAKTRIQLSVSTLKRIWGKVRYDNFPATATLNALVAYLGYESWREFRQKNCVTEDARAGEKEFEEAAAQPAAPAEKLPAKSSNVYMIISLVAVLLIAATLILNRKQADVDPSKIKFQAVLVSDTLPNSVVFNYDATAFHSDSVFIQQSWDPRRREQVDGNAHQFTSIYYNPGYFLARLIVNNQIKKECVVNIHTKGWLGVVEKDPIPTYLSVKESGEGGFLGISAATLQQKTGTPVFNNTWVKFANVRDFSNIDPNNFTFETHVRNTSAVEASVCRRVNVLLLLKGKAIIIPLSDKGCISEIGLLAADTAISGKDHDLSAFGCDFSKFQDLKCSVHNRHFTIYLDNKRILDLALKNKLPGIAGIRFEFEGAGQVKDVMLTTPGAGSYTGNF